jgi:ketosteroid isomerase-like protein
LDRCQYPTYTRWIAAWERFQAERLDLIDAGDAVVLVSRITRVGKGSGAEVQMRAADVFFVEDRRIVRHVGYPDAAEALADLGLST